MLPLVLEAIILHPRYDSLFLRPLTAWRDDLPSPRPLKSETGFGQSRALRHALTRA